MATPHSTTREATDWIERVEVVDEFHAYVTVRTDDDRIVVYQIPTRLLMEPEVEDLDDHLVVVHDHH